MRFLEKGSIKQKLTRINLLISAAALLVACGAFAVYDLISLRQILTHELVILSDVIAENIMAPVEFQDQKTGKKTLAVLRTNPRIIYSKVFHNGKLFTEYGRKGQEKLSSPEKPRNNGSYFEDNSIKLFRSYPMDEGGVVTVFIQSDLEELSGSLKNYALATVSVLILSLLVAYFLSFRMQRLISKPIQNLAQTADRVSDEEDYSIRAAKLSEDELGDLVDRFNEMLEKIGNRDRALHEARNELEDRVEERTRKLKSEIAIRERTESMLLGQNQALKSLTERKPIQEIMDALNLLVERQISGCRSSILLLDETGQYLSHGSSCNLPPAYVKAIDGVAIGPKAGSCGTAAFKKEIVVVTDIANDPLWENSKELAVSHGLRACWSVPIFGNQQDILGIFAAYFKNPRRPTDAEMDIIKSSAHITGLAINQKNVERKNELHASRQNAIATLGKLAIGGAPLQDLMDRAVCFISEILEVEYAQVLEILLREDRLKLRAGIGWKPGMAGKATVSAGPESHAGFTLQSKEPVMIPDLREETRFSQEPLLKDHAVVSGLSVVIQGPGKPFGVLGAHSTRPRLFTKEEVQFLQTIANILAETIKITRAEKQLKNYAAELERSNRELQEFASIASHDLQEPLRKIMSFSHRLIEKSRDLDEDSQSYLERLEKASKRMQRYLDDLFDYSKVTTRARPFERIHLETVVQGVLEDLEWSIKDTQATINLKELPTLEVDEFQMRQLFQNLISNALKFHKEGVPLIIDIESRRLPNDRWEILVKDNGIGFDEIYRDRIFNPFERLHPMSKYEGTGIGLAICHKIVTRHGGEIKAESQPNVGTTLRIIL